MSTRFETAVVKFRPQLPPEEISELIRDKENIEITDQINIILDVREQKEIEVKIKNNGNVKQKIFKCSFLSKMSESQLSLISPKHNEHQDLRPADEVTFKFKCRAKLVGVCEELIIFKFRTFKVGRIITIRVNSINPKNAKDSNGAPSNTYDHNSRSSIIPQIYEEGMYVKGVKPYKPAKFIAVRPVSWKIPAILWATMNEIKMDRKTTGEAQSLLTERIPVLHQHLNFQNYKQRFGYLLYLEEIAQIEDMQRFNMSSATMHRSGEYLTLNVPGLSEKRPSLIIGDRVIVSFRWDATNGM